MTDQTASEAPQVEEPDFAGVRNRLQKIAVAVEDPDISLDDALDLYEEAVSLGLKASDLLEVGIAGKETAQSETTGEADVSTPDGTPAQPAATTKGASAEA